MTRDAYAWHRAALAARNEKGAVPRENLAHLGLSEDAPQCGLYALPTERDHNNRFVPPARGPYSVVVIWWGEDELQATLDGVPVPPADVWSWVCRYPIGLDELERWERSLKGQMALMIARNPDATAGMTVAL